MSLCGRHKCSRHKCSRHKGSSHPSYARFIPYRSSRTPPVSLALPHLTDFWDFAYSRRIIVLSAAEGRQNCKYTLYYIPTATRNRQQNCCESAEPHGAPKMGGAYRGERETPPTLPPSPPKKKHVSKTWSDRRGPTFSKGQMVQAVTYAYICYTRLRRVTSWSMLCFHACV